MTILTTGKRRRGFTLAEMLVVLAVIGIIAMVATPAFMAFTRHSRLNGAARIISTAFRTARGYGITLRVTSGAVLQVDLTNNAVQIYETSDIVKWYDLPENVDLWTAGGSNSGNVTYRFMADGSITNNTGGSPENLRVWENQGEAGRQRYVQINLVSATGKVKVGDVISP